MLRSLVLLAIAAPAVAAPHPRAVFDAKIETIGTASPFLCGGAMALQPVKVKVTKVTKGTLKVGDSPTVQVLTCFGGHLLRPMKPDGVFELDPDKIRPGSEIHVDAEDLAKNAWFATVDNIAVTKR